MFLFVKNDGWNYFNTEHMVYFLHITTIFVEQSPRNQSVWPISVSVTLNVAHRQGFDGCLLQNTAIDINLELNERTAKASKFLPSESARQIGNTQQARNVDSVLA